MKMKPVKRILLYAFSVATLLLIILAVHIYLVTRPKAPDENTRIMARIDIKEPVTPAQSGVITDWLYRQPGVDHVLVNPRSSIAVFTYSPLKMNPDTLLVAFRKDLRLPAERFIPRKEDLMKGCPVAASSGITAFFKKIF